MDKKWHSFEVNEVEQALNTHIETGLSNEEAQLRLEQDGRNELPEKKTDSKIKKFLSHFNDVLIYVLFGAAVITALLGHYIDTSVILLVTIINAFIGYFQENQAEKALNGIKALLSLTANVRRNGERLEIDAAEVVVGDAVILSAGDKVPADLRLVDAHNLRVEESASLANQPLLKNSLLYSIPILSLMTRRTWSFQEHPSRLEAASVLLQQ